MCKISYVPIGHCHWEERYAQVHHATGRFKHISFSENFIRKKHNTKRNMVWPYRCCVEPTKIIINRKKYVTVASHSATVTNELYSAHCTLHSVHCTLTNCSLYKRIFHEIVFISICTNMFVCMFAA